jgi:BolA protein
MRSANERIASYEEALRKSLHPMLIEFYDDSHLHLGHAGASGGAGHYRVKIVSKSFEGLTRVRRHQLVYDALKAWFPDEIHALIINAYLPEEL